jgi:hypothetical protein
VGGSGYTGCQRPLRALDAAPRSVWVRRTMGGQRVVLAQTIASVSEVASLSVAHEHTRPHTRKHCRGGASQLHAHPPPPPQLPNHIARWAARCRPGPVPANAPCFNIFSSASGEMDTVSDESGMGISAPAPIMPAMPPMPPMPPMKFMVPLPPNPQSTCLGRNERSRRACVRATRRAAGPGASGDARAMPRAAERTNTAKTATSPNRPAVACRARCVRGRPAGALSRPHRPV